MEVVTRHNVEDEIYFIANGDIKKGKISEIKIEIKKRPFITYGINYYDTEGKRNLQAYCRESIVFKTYEALCEYCKDKFK